MNVECVLFLNFTFSSVMSVRQGILTVKVEKYQSVVGRAELPFFPSFSGCFLISLDFYYGRGKSGKSDLFANYQLRSREGKNSCGLKTSNRF